MSQIWNFSSGPATLPRMVLEKISSELMSWDNKGISVLEMSHRSNYFADICYEAEKDLRDLLNLSSDYAVIFSHAGGHAANSFIPMNLIERTSKRNADFIVSGHWSDVSFRESKKYGNVRVIADNNSLYSKNGNLYNPRRWMPSLETWDFSKVSSYVYLCSNETIDGIEFCEWPNLLDYSVDSELVVDASSNLLTRPMFIEKVGIIFACAQKNLGIAGLTLVIIKKDLLGFYSSICPSSFNYTNLAKTNSLYSTPPIFAIYVAGLMFKWLKFKGGLQSVAEENYQKSETIYNYIDSTDFYNNNVETSVRSKVNIPFVLHDACLNDIFLSEAEESGFINLNGHRSVGGMRASIYNSMPMSAVQSLINYMREFERVYG
ncbi:phosphoserine aminotransferase [Candidatus Kinetoplastibacterium desouzaii TCC079E]|uniref:Phosphoserine aminotransferase n=1 Tax=Candidatus Kinetoplastidibacterium desouzai TCC079E TaxID=1208919 RepID=M1LS60_9PROT|nr:3-phosphoserine/phosphohydroxythreonine transaminase [Candidatus Kinetoplastibacterium desouzaii]AGF46981.1 phosphoserine aminotransferase [Candidatus Kinetoplastibacterium desouzaii TCC079E]